jgi:hypothetical protein
LCALSHETNSSSSCGLKRGLERSHQQVARNFGIPHQMVYLPRRIHLIRHDSSRQEQNTDEKTCRRRTPRRDESCSCSAPFTLVSGVIILACVKRPSMPKPQAPPYFIEAPLLGESFLGCFSQLNRVFYCKHVNSYTFSSTVHESLWIGVAMLWINCSAVQMHVLITCSVRTCMHSIHTPHLHACISFGI